MMFPVTPPHAEAASCRMTGAGPASRRAGVSVAPRSSGVCVGRAGPRVAAMLAALAVGGCGQSDEARARAAVMAKFPDGQRRCMPLSREQVGIHVPNFRGSVPYYPATGPTSPLRHMFVLYAAPSRFPVPELVTLLAEAGLATKLEVQASADLETTGLGPVVVSAQGWRSHLAWFHHERRTMGVSIWLVPEGDPRFDYGVFTDARFSNGNFPSLVYGDPLPSVDVHYALPTRVPYALSVVSSACSTERVEAVTHARRTTLLNGMPVVWADVTWRQDVPDWMRTPAFSRAAVRGNTGSVQGLRTASTGFAVDGDRLTYVEEQRP